MLENLMFASKFDNLCPKFAEGRTKRYSKKEDMLYNTILLFFHYKTYKGGFFKYENKQER